MRVPTWWRTLQAVLSIELARRTIPTYRGYTFYFGAVNLELFEDDPDAYAPKYGGFCAFGLSGEDPANTIATLNQLSTVPSNPDVFTVYDGQLYIFRGEGAKDLFLEDIDELIDGADSSGILVWD